MKVCIDTEECKKLNIPISTACYIASLYFNEIITDRTFVNACSKGFIEYKGFDTNRNLIDPRLTQGGIDIIESVFLNSEFKAPDGGKDRFDNLANKLREIFPKGRKPGTNYQWRDSNVIIAKRLKALVKNYNAKFTDEEAIDATKRYVESFNGNYSYMQLLKYFISKKKVIDGEVEETSQLLSFIENKDNDSINNDWMLEMR